MTTVASASSSTTCYNIVFDILQVIGGPTSNSSLPKIQLFVDAGGFSPSNETVSPFLINSGLSIAQNISTSGQCMTFFEGNILRLKQILNNKLNLCTDKAGYGCTISASYTCCTGSLCNAVDGAALILFPPPPQPPPSPSPPLDGADFCPLSTVPCGVGLCTSSENETCNSENQCANSSGMVVPCGPHALPTPAGKCGFVECLTACGGFDTWGGAPTCPLCSELKACICLATNKAPPYGLCTKAPPDKAPTKILPPSRLPPPPSSPPPSSTSTSLAEGLVISSLAYDLYLREPQV